MDELRHYSSTGPIDFSALEKYRENNRIEAKLAVGGFPHSVWETYSAFANTIGGIILMGVEELPDKSFRAADLPDAGELALDFTEQVQDKKIVSENILAPDGVKIVLSQGKPIVMVRVPRATDVQKPIYVGTDPYSGTYKRSGEGDYRCSAAEVTHMLRQREELLLEEQLLDLLTAARTVTAQDAAAALEISAPRAGNLLSGLTNRGILTMRRQNGRRVYSLREN